MSISVPDIIARKRDGGELSDQEIQYFIDACVNQTAQPAQIGAWLMAVFLNDMTRAEAIGLTRAMLHSGYVFTWPKEWRGHVVDKHSTGGVGDKVSLVLAPALAACGMKVPMISGRGLAHTGGTLDKLEAIPGYCVNLSQERMSSLLTTVGCCIVGQTESLVPADKILYSLRDITGTVANNSLITGSIISKKAAEGLDCLVLDVKTGNGAFMDTREKAETLATTMVEVANGMGIKTASIISSMDSPLGYAVGNALEVAESVHTLQGKGPHDLLDLVVNTGAVTLQLAGKAKSHDEGCSKIREVINDLTALAKFRQMIVGQGVSDDVANQLCDVNGDVWNVLTPAPHKTVLKCPKKGFVQGITAMPCALAAHKLGAGRSRQGESIDLAVGLYFTVALGEAVSEGQPWVTVHHFTQEAPAEVKNLLDDALVIVPELASPIPQSRVINIISPQGSNLSI